MLTHDPFKDPVVGEIVKKKAKRWVTKDGFYYCGNHVGHWCIDYPEVRKDCKLVVCRIQVRTP